MIEQINNSLNRLAGAPVNGFTIPHRAVPAAEAILAGILRACPAGVGCLTDNLITEVNPQLCEMTGHTPAELIGFPFSRLFAQATEFDRVQTALQQQLASEPVASLETSWMRADGVSVEVRLTITATSERSRVFTAIATNQAETRQLEARLLRAQRLESIGTLAGGLAHDLNNVLAPILMSVHMLKEEAVNDSVRICVEMLETCAQRGSELIAQVLTLPRAAEGSRALVHPRHLLKDIHRVVMETFPRTIRLENKASKDTPLIECEATQIQQMLMNLCLNARDAMPQGGTLTLRSEAAHLGPDATILHPQAKPGTYAVLSVTDTGTGMTAEVMAQMFDPCFTTKGPAQGTGLGLPAVKAIAEAHRGFVLVESKVGQGSTFRVYLPATINEREAIPAPEATNLPQGRGETVLVVDDEPAIRRVVEVILTKNGYAPLVAVDGREALTLFQRNKDRVAFLVSDLMMPNQDGPTTIRAIRACKPSVRVVAMTGLGEESDFAKATVAGAEAMLKKPFGARQLLTVLNELRESQR